MNAGVLNEVEHSSVFVAWRDWQFRMGVFRYLSSDLPWFYACRRDDRRMGTKRARMWQLRLDVFAVALAREMRTSTGRAEP
jgi:hypothetical protein